MLTGVLAVPGSAQVSVRVVDADGRPIPAVQVDVLGRGALIDVGFTSARGIAELNADRWSEVRRISLSHLGFQTLIVQVDEIPLDGVIQLSPRAIAIDGFTVEAGAPCPTVDDPAARRLWSEVAARYATDTGTRSWFSYMSLYSGSVSETDLHRTAGAEAVRYLVAGGSGVIHGGDHNPRSLDDRVAAEGYAWPPLAVGGTTSGRSLSWAYPQLEREHAYHFASSVFGALHGFSIAGESDEQTTLVFCGKQDSRGATIQGSMTLVPGEAFLAADWRFVTRAPDEGAGGSVSFTSYVEQGAPRPHLMASAGYFYRHNGREPPYPDLPRTYGRWGVADARWHLNPSAERPCNGGISFYGDPPTTPEGMRLAECVREHWADPPGPALGRRSPGLR